MYNLLLDQAWQNESIDSAAYVVFYAGYHGTKIAIGLYLTKASSHGVIEYYIDDDNTSVERAWECTPPESNCSSQACKPHRNWFLGPVQGCTCKNDPGVNCTLVNSGSGLSWGDIIGIIGVILPFLL